MKFNVLKLFGFIVIAIGCANLKSSEAQSPPLSNVDSRIVFIDIKDFDRGGLASTIERIVQDSASVIGVNLLFENWFGTAQDSMLLKSLGKASKIVLLAGTTQTGRSLLRSHSLFRTAATGEGVNSFILENGEMLLGYIPLLQLEEEQILNFAHEIAYSYGKVTSMPFRSLRVNREEDFRLHVLPEKFKILDASDTTKFSVKDKIVIIDDFSNERNDVLTLDLSGNKILVHQAVVDANIILKLLN